MCIGWCARCASAALCELSRAAEKAMTIAADVCVYTNHNFTTEALRSEVTKEEPSKLLAGP